jgi:hypothetical protein
MVRTTPLSPRKRGVKDLKISIPKGRHPRDGAQGITPMDDANGYHPLARKGRIKRQSGSQLVMALTCNESELTILGDAKL